MLSKLVRKSQGGFTLVELMITVVIISILAMVAIPAYNDSVRKGRRSDAKSTLANIAARQEQYFMDNKTYAGSLSDLGMASTSTDKHYDLSITGASATTFVAKAQPVAEDPECQTMTLDQSGTRGVEAGTSPATAAPEWDAEVCW